MSNNTLLNLLLVLASLFSAMLDQPFSIMDRVGKEQSQLVGCTY